jgi:hypothetical protein
VIGIQGDWQPGRPAADYRQAGTLMGVIGADMAAPEQMAPSLGISVNFNSLAVAFNQEGLKLATDPDAANVSAARKLCRTVLSFTEQDRVHDHVPGITPEVITQVMQQMACRLPSPDQYGWAQ